MALSAEIVTEKCKETVGRIEYLSSDFLPELFVHCCCGREIIYSVADVASCSIKMHKLENGVKL